MKLLNTKLIFFKQKSFLIKSFLKLNINIFKTLLKIFNKIKLRTYGFNVLLAVKKKYIIFYLKIIKYNSTFLFNYLLDIVVTDYPWKKNRFFIRYIVRSLVYSRLIFIDVKTQLYKSIFSVTNLFNSALWVERECWDFFGVFFLYHKNLKRILTDYGFKGNPLKKDFPLTGYQELFFNVFYSSLNYRNITPFV